METSSSGGVGRRALLASTATAAAGLSGCLQRFRSVQGRDRPEQVSLEVVAPPADEDAVATKIGRTLDKHLSAAGIDTELALLPRTELRRQVLIEDEYDLFVSSYSQAEEPDALRSMLHSSFSNESGWQNPFNFTNLDIDELLMAQRSTTGTERTGLVTELQREVAKQQPFTVVAVPDEIRAVQSQQATGWNRYRLDSPLNLVALETSDRGVDRVGVVATDDRMTYNLNPLAIEYRNDGVFTGLIYDQLCRRYDGAIRPWLAREWTVDRDGDDSVITVHIRPDLTWHDGAPLTADDVAFTFEFLADTSLDQFEASVPAPRFRGRTSLVDGVEVLDSERVRLSFPATATEVATRALTLPVLPRHIWADKSRAAEIAGLDTGNGVTEALIWSNLSPVGSGPFTVDSRIEGEQLVLRRFDDHFLARESQDSLDQFDQTLIGGPSYEELSVRVVRSDEAAVDLLTTADVDAVVSSLDSGAVPIIGRQPGTELLVDTAREFYLVGYNAARHPLGNPHFRRFVASLLDKEYIVEQLFDGYATPAASPLAGTNWLAPSLRWDERDPEIPFAGTDGELDVEQARNSLREAGFEYSKTGTLLQQ